MTALKACRRGLFGHVRRAGVVALMGIITALILLQPKVSDAAVAGNNPPTNVACQGWEVNTVIISWKDNDTDEVDYRIERSIDGAAFTEIHTSTPNGSGNYDGYHDTGVDVNKNYRYRVHARHGDGTFTDYGPICSKRRFFDTNPGVANNGFGVFFGLEGTTDDCPAIDGHDVCLANTSSGGNNVFVTLQQTALEGAPDAFQRVGFDRDAAVPNSGLDKIPVNVIWCDGGGCAGGSSLGLSPFLMEMPFNTTTRVGDPIAFLVGEHEVFHFQQFKYGGLNDPAGNWVVEGQARSSQDKICLGARSNNLCFDDIATGYAGYVGELNGYLANTANPVNQSSYGAALFWTYVTEKFGAFAPSDDVEAGMDLLAQFWKESTANTGRDGIAVLNSALQTLGTTTLRFRDIWKDFAVANYAKNLTGSGVQAKYKYRDMSQTGGNYNQVSFAVNQPLALNVPFLRLGETIYPWAAKYYKFTPAANVPVLDIRVTQDTNTPVYYTVLGVRNNDVIYEFNAEARNLNQTVLNNAFTEVVVMVAGLDNLANYRVSVNGTQPSLVILSPTATNKARVGANTAPEKFRVAVQVLAGDGTPLSGVDLSLFNFRIGATNVPAGQILTSAHVQDQQWFILRAVTQTAPGAYDLHVNYANNASLAATQTLAVNYAPRIDADNMLIIDDSGSMAGNKMQAAKNAANLYVDSWRTGDKIGVVGFDSVPTLRMELQDWTDSPSGGTRQVAFDAINGLVADGGTNIGDSLMMGFDRLKALGNPAHDWALILLSDGNEEDSSPTVPFATAISNIAGAPGKRPVIHAIAIGPDADGPKMQSAANATGGTYQFASIPDAASVAAIDSPNSPDSPMAISNPNLNLDARYRFIATDVLGQQQFFSFVGPVKDRDTFSDTVPIPVEGSAAELIVSLSFDGGCGCNIFLMDPLGAVVPRHETAPSFRHIVWRVANPMAGIWHLNIYVQVPGLTSAGIAPQADITPQAVEDFVPYLVESSVKSDVILDVDFTVPVTDRVSGVPMPIVASLTDLAPITGATVNANIVGPGNTIYPALPLYDDGSHGDGEANDGIYANTFYQTGASGTNSGAGSYDVTVVANGNSATAGNFVRQKLLGFFIFSSGDTDGDGLPDEYEETHCGSKTCLDPEADPDNDGKDTGDEFHDGTDPLDPDSDDGGGTDGSEATNGTDPHNPNDDGIQPTWAVAYAGVSKVFVRYAPRPEYVSTEIWRSEELSGTAAFSGTYALKLTDLTPSGMVTDTDVVNDHEYCYFAIGVNAANMRSTPLTPSCATPKADPLAPDGGFIINGGAASTLSTTVTLDIFASDSVSPHILEGGDPLDAIMEPPADSATEVTEMRISNNGDMSGAAFVPYATTAPWVLGQSSGLAMVYMQFRDAAGNLSRIVPNSIFVGAGNGPGLNPATLVLSKDVNNSTPEVGSNVVFTVVITNTGPGNASGVTVQDKLPNGYTFVADDGNGSYNAGSGIWTIGTLFNGDSATLHITATVNASGNYVNYAQVLTSTGVDPDATPGNGSTNETDDDSAVILPKGEINLPFIRRQPTP